ncbi:hypothetical protein C6P40_002894 [Pichia californica]|uniref:Mtf2-like C-terminal domain-containing protein n=1 Tax=Pichia californica TaxID=460514 RepID=A0A9P6WH78_9ASCO|nr:hypothetical protein C6P42_003452 [[Candida] californica]KAG0687081.1 hypothetical protein C6P40_002894 [[Candida] californica]
MSRYKLILRTYSTTKLGKTFGEFQKETLNSKNSTNLNNESLITKIKENNVYKNFFENFEKLKKDSEKKNRITSFEEQKSFKQVFDYLSKESNKIGIVKSLETFVNFQSPLQQQQQQNNKNSSNDENKNKFSFFKSTSNPINLEIQYKNKTELNKNLLEALLPTLNFINKNINSTNQMQDFVKENIINSFLKNLNNKSNNNKNFKNQKINLKYSINDIKLTSLKNPEFPIVDIQTLPLLIKFCLNSLTFDFNSISNSLSLIEFIKNHESIELYGFGLNIDCYNAILIQIWSKTENLNIIGNLVDELKINAIQPDLYTFKILSKIYLQCMRVKDTVKSEPYIIWNSSSNIHKIRDYLQDFRFL